jgi:hypothetical protein
VEIHTTGIHTHKLCFKNTYNTESANNAQSKALGGVPKYSFGLFYMTLILFVLTIRYFLDTEIYYIRKISEPQELENISSLVQNI